MLRFKISSTKNYAQDGSVWTKNEFHKPMFFDVDFDERTFVWLPGTKTEERHENLGEDMEWSVESPSGALFYKLERMSPTAVIINRYKEDRRGNKVLVVIEKYTLC